MTNPGKVIADAQRALLFDPHHSGWGQRGCSAGTEREPPRRPELGRLVGLRELLRRGHLHGALLALAMRDPIPSMAVAGRIPWWAFSGGLFGAIFIALAILLIPTLGTATFVVLLVTGQMLASVTIDHFGWLGLPEHPIDLPRLIGTALLIGGCVLIRR